MSAPHTRAERRSSHGHCERVRTRDRPPRDSDDRSSEGPSALAVWTQLPILRDPPTSRRPGPSLPLSPARFQRRRLLLLRPSPSGALSFRDALHVPCLAFSRSFFSSPFPTRLCLHLQNPFPQLCALPWAPQPPAPHPHPPLSPQNLVSVANTSPHLGSPLPCSRLSPCGSEGHLREPWPCGKAGGHPAPRCSLLGTVALSSRFLLKCLSLGPTVSLRRLFLLPPLWPVLAVPCPRSASSTPPRKSLPLMPRPLAPPHMPPFPHHP